MPKPAQLLPRPHIVKDPEICGGSPVIAGTRFPVRSVAHYIIRLGLTPEELIEKFSHLSLAQIYDALAYYYDNRQEIDRDIAENTEELIYRPS